MADSLKSSEQDSPLPEEVEAHILKFSVYGATAFALLGLTWGTVIRSQMIIFDGIYSFISVITASVSVFAAACMLKGHDKTFPFGRWQMEPMVIVMKSLVLLALCLNAIFMAVNSLLAGATEVNLASGATYSFIGAMGCVGGWFYITSQRKKAGASGLVESEAMQWLMDGLLSAAILAGFVTAYLLQFTVWAPYASYADPIMTIAAALFFLKTPLIALGQGLRDLLIMTPDKEIREKVRVELGEIASNHGFKDLQVRLGRTGQVYLFHVTYLAPPDDKPRSMQTMDEIHRLTDLRIKELCEQPKQVSVYFTGDLRWAG